MAPRFDLTLVSTKSLKELLLADWRQLDNEAAILEELQRRNDAARQHARDVASGVVSPDGVAI